MKSRVRRLLIFALLLICYGGSRGLYCKEIALLNSLEKLERYAVLMREYGPGTAPHEGEGIRTRMYRFLGFSHMPWEPSAFKKLLDSVIEDRCARGFSSHSIQKIERGPGSNFVIFGPLDGGIHFLVRTLRCLENLKIINNDLKIINPHYALIFNGNSKINNHYDREVLTVILQLMAKNPDSVFYVKNIFEAHDRWRESWLMSQLSQNLKLYYLEPTTYSKLLDQFFNTLPLALYIVGARNGKNIEVVKIANDSIEFQGRLLHEQDLGSFFSWQETDIACLQSYQAKKAGAHVKEVGIIHDLADGANAVVGHVGLKMIGLVDGTADWLLGPASFGVLTTARQSNDWVVTLLGSDKSCKHLKAFNVATGKALPELLYQERMKQLLQERLDFYAQEIEELREKEDQVRLIKLEIELASLENRPVNVDVVKTVHQVVAGPSVPSAVTHGRSAEKTVSSMRSKEAIPGVLVPAARPIKSKEKIEISTFFKGVSGPVLKIGSMMDLSRAIKNISLSVQSGIELVLSQVNEEGGIEGTHLEIHTFDDEYTADQAFRVMTELIEKLNINIILSPAGAPPLEGYKKFIKDGKIAVFFPLAGSTTVRSSSFQNVVFYRASFVSESEALAKYALSSLYAKRISILFQNDISDAKEGALKVFKQNNFSAFQTLEYSQDSTNFAKHAEAVNQFAPDTIIMLMTPMAARAFIRDMKTEVLGGKNLLGSSNLHDESFRAFVQGIGLNIITSSIIPNFMSTALPIAQEFRIDAQRKGLKPNTFMFEGYINTRIFVYLLRKIIGPITKEKLLAAAQDVKNVDFHGLKLNFDQNTRGLSSVVWLDLGGSEWTEVNV